MHTSRRPPIVDNFRVYPLDNVSASRYSTYIKNRAANGANEMTKRQATAKAETMALESNTDTMVIREAGSRSYEAIAYPTDWNWFQTWRERFAYVKIVERKWLGR